MTWIYGIAASLLTKLFSCAWGSVQKMWRALLTKKAIEKKNQSIMEETLNAETEEERKAALRRAAEHLGNPNP